MISKSCKEGLKNCRGGQMITLIYGWMNGCSSAIITNKDVWERFSVPTCCYLLCPREETSERRQFLPADSKRVSFLTQSTHAMRCEIHQPVIVAD